MLQIGRVKNLDEEIGSICLVSKFSSWVRKVHVLKFSTDLSKKCKSVKIIHIYPSESYSLKMIWFTGVWVTVYEILALKTSKTFSAEI